MIVFLLLSTVACFCLARPNTHDVDPQNIVTVPPNCPDGQEWINGQCRDVWRASSICPRGQLFANGLCRETSKAIDIRDGIVEPQNAETVLRNCKQNQNWVNGICQDVWRTGADINGIPPNIVTVPPNCPPGQVLISGACREIWRAGFESNGAVIDPIKESNLMKIILKTTFSGQEITKQDYEDDLIGSLKNIISVPNQCPAGYKPDALGICREIFD